MTIAVIIPVWNDATALRSALASVVGSERSVLECGGLPPLSIPPVDTTRFQSGGKPPHSKEEGVSQIEILVVDGGSDDDPVAVARPAGVCVLSSPIRQRAAQMNLGAQVARADVLMFLHADTQLPAGWARAVAQAFTRDPELAGGAFRRRFVPGSCFLRATCALADFRGRWGGWFLGDQAMFVRRVVFAQLGGFAPLRACEDLDFSRRLARHGRVRLLREMVLTSDRRFRARGPLRQTLADLATVRRFLRSPESFRELSPPVGSSAPPTVTSCP